MKTMIHVELWMAYLHAAEGHVDAVTVLTQTFLHYQEKHYRVTLACSTGDTQ